MAHIPTIKHTVVSSGTFLINLESPEQNHDHRLHQGVSFTYQHPLNNPKHYLTNLLSPPNNTRNITQKPNRQRKTPTITTTRPPRHPKRHNTQKIDKRLPGLLVIHHLDLHLPIPLHRPPHPCHHIHLHTPLTLRNPPQLPLHHPSLLMMRMRMMVLLMMIPSVRERRRRPSSSSSSSSVYHPALHPPLFFEYGK